MSREPVIVAYGAGRDSTALLIEMHRRGWRPDAILFANIGSEKRATYEYLPIINEWLHDHDFPTVTTVRYEPKSAPYRTLEGNMILNATLPGATFNKHTCTMKFKVEPQTKWTAAWQPAQQAWAAGRKVTKLIGFECGEEYRLRRADAKAHAGRFSKEAERFDFRYPLVDWGLDLGDCIEIIKRAGLPVPVKSACYFCPNQQPAEVADLTPEDRARVILMELTAEPYNQKVEGLWRRTRKSDGRPGSITEYILQQGLPFTPLTDLCRKVVLNPNCKKAAAGGTHTFEPPHKASTLRELLIAHGHAVPEVVAAGDREEPGVYWEDVREAPAEVEYAAHQLVALAC
jgi:hypothetical protein